GAFQFLVQAPALRRTGFRFKPGLDFKDPGLRQVLALMGPAIIGTAAVQVNVFVNNNFASRLADGAVSWLNYSFRLMQFPIGVFGVAIATATLPAIARAAARQDREEYRATLAQSLRFALFLTVPSAVGLIALARPIIALIYERGSFHPADTLATASALGCYAVGLVGYSCVKILAPAFYALDDPRTPARVSLLSILVNLVLCWFLVEPLGHRGLALSTACVATANALLLAFLLRARAGPLRGREIAACFLKVALASAVLWAACRFSLGALEARLPGSGLGARTLVVLGSISAGGLAFFAVCVLLRVEEARSFLRFFRRRGGAR
ncbi:MAG: murein biosynthesis integral membrane protein MurJ, partial [Planctomycetes bacterium]|nr:murein biosynthesis integral membrane protein MurJ [Planctomycetota bacterium]